MTDDDALSIRRGIAMSMKRIREQLMLPGEWDDPAVAPLHRINRALMDTGRARNTDLVMRAAHEHSVRWVIRRQFHRPEVADLDAAA